MATKAELKYYASLKLKKVRISEKKFIAEGKKLVQEAIESDYICDIVFATPLFEESNSKFITGLKSKTIRIEIIPNHEFLKLCDTQTPQGIAGIIRQKETSGQIGQNVGLIAALEDISDPGNLGTIMRNCDWFGVSTLILSNECAELYNPKSIRASMGSLFHLNIIEPEDFNGFLSGLKNNGYEILCADLSGVNIFEFAFPEKSVVIFSNEAHGPSQDIISISKQITIPKYGNAESLNVANASAVILSCYRNKYSN